MAWTLETVLGVVPRDRAAKVRALSIRGNDPARRVQQEESAFAKEDRPVIRRGELPEDLRLTSDRHGLPETLDLVHANEGRDRRGQLAGREPERCEESCPQKSKPHVLRRRH